MSLVDRLKRAVLSILGVGREDRSRESSTGTDEGESTSADTATESLNVESRVIESDDSEDGSGATESAEDGPQIGEERRGEIESESAPTEPESESKPTEEEEPVEADESKPEGTSEAEEGEEPGIDLEEDAAPAPEEAADTSEVEEPGTEEKPAESETGEPEVEPDAGEQEAESVAEESGSKTEEPDTGFEFEEVVGESESAEPDQEPESTVEESESEAAESGSLETESESRESESSIREDESDVEESIPDKPETTTEPDDEGVEIPETDEAEEELESSLEEGESEETEVSESTEIETDSIDASGGEAEDGSASEGADIDVFDEEFEPVESDPRGKESDSIVEPEPDDLPTEESETDQELSTSTTTSERQIPYALDPEGNEVHVDDAEEGKPYICKECEWLLKLRTSDKIQNYFAHKRGGPDDCSLKSESTPIEGDDRDTKEQRQLPVFFSHSTRSTLLGEIPALKIDDFDDPVNIPTELENIQVETQGTQDNPQPDWFRPTKSRIDVRLDPDADEYQITVDSDGRFESIEGNWYASGLEPGDVFVGETAQAERMKTESPVVKEGQWVYVVLDNLPETLPEAVEIYRVGSRDILGVEVNDDTLGLLQQYADVEPSGEASFRAHILMPPDVDPRSETVHGPPGTKALLGIQPTGESDPVFHILIPGNKEQNTVIDAVGEGTPRFYAAEIPQDGSDRYDIHGLGESESIELAARDDQDDPDRSWTEEPVIGVHVGDGDGNTQLHNPIKGPSHQFGPNIDADAITDSIVFEGPDGYRFDLKGEFPDNVDFASVLRRSEVTAEEAKTAISNWIREGCDRIEIDFDAAGKTELVFDRELDCRVVLEAAVTIYDVEEEEDAINIAVPKVGRMLNPDLSYVEINAPDVPCPHCGEEHRPAFVAAGRALVRLELTMEVRGVENTAHAEKIAKAEIGKRIQGIPLKTVEVERL